MSEKKKSDYQSLLDNFIAILEITQNFDDVNAPDGSEYLAVILTIENYKLVDNNLWFSDRDTLDLSIDQFEKEKKRLQIRADNNDSDAQFRLSLNYYYGGITPRNLDKAFLYCEFAAKKNHVKAQYQLSMLYLNGHGVEKDLTRSLKYTQLAADNGHPIALRYLGSMFYSGEGVTKDQLKGINYWKLGAEVGDPECQYNFGTALFHGEFIERDDEQAVNYWRLAAEQSEVDAQLNLANYFRTFEVDIKQELYFLMLAADQGNATAQMRIGYYLIESDNNEEFEAGKRYLKRAADQGDKDAQLFFASLEEEGIINLPTNRGIEIVEVQLQSFRMMTMSQREKFFIEACKHGLVSNFIESSEDDLDLIIAAGEDGLYEFKQTLSLDVDRIRNDLAYKPEKESKIETGSLKTIAGFLNSQGGTLLIGVADNHDIIGLQGEIDTFYPSLDKLLLYFKDLIVSRLDKSVFANLTITTPETKGTKILRVDVSPSTTPVFLQPNDEFYVRTTPATEKLAGTQLVNYLNEHEHFR